MRTGYCERLACSFGFGSYLIAKDGGFAAP